MKTRDAMLAECFGPLYETRRCTTCLVLFGTAWTKHPANKPGGRTDRGAAEQVVRFITVYVSNICSTAVHCDGYM